MTAPVTIQLCIEVAAAEFGVSLRTILYSDRTPLASAPRQIAMWLAHCLTTKSHAQIGRALAGRDGSTVRHGIRKIEEMRAGDVAFMARTDRLRESLKTTEKAA